MMRSSKFQVPSSKEAPNSKLQKWAAFSRSLTWWEDEPPEELLVLKDEPPDNSDGRPPFDLEERTALFGGNIVRFSKKIPHGPTNNRLIDQLVGCATSVGANYCEANEAVAKKDFRNSIGRCKKEVKETKFFLRMIVASEPQLGAVARVLYREATELQRILATMYRK
jgi:four helix bundle protein